MDLEKIQQKCLKRGLKKFDIYASERISDTMKFQSNVLNSVNTKQTSGIGIRAVHNNKVGLASANSIDEKGQFGTTEETLIDKVSELAAYGDTAHFDFPSESRIEIKKELTPVNSLADSIIALSENVIQDFLKLDHTLKIDCGFSKSFSRSHLVNSRNSNLYKENEIFSYSVSFAKTGDGNILEVWDAVEQVTPITESDIAPIIENLKFLYEHSIVYSSVNTGKYPVLFTPKAFQSLLDILLSAFKGSLIYKKASYLTNKLNEKIADNNFSLIEDPLYQNGVVYAPYDHEGVKTAKKYLIQNGIVKNFITTLSSAEKLQYAASSGNGFRSYASLPSESFTNLIVEPGASSFEELVKKVHNGLIVDQLIGAGQSNVLSGEFSVNIDLGFKIENGEIKGRVKNAMMADNVYHILNRIMGIGNELKSFGNLFLPYIAFSDLNIAAG